MLIPSVGHFGDMPDVLATVREANSGEEAINIMSEEYCKNPFGKEDFIQGRYHSIRLECLFKNSFY